MIERLNVLATTFDTKDIRLEHGDFKIEPKGIFSKTLTYSASSIKSFEIANDDNTKKIGGTLMGATVGGVLTGGAGAVVGALAGGNKKTVIFIVDFNDGNKLMAESSYKAYIELTAKIKQFEFDNIKKEINQPKAKNSFLQDIKDGIDEAGSEKTSIKDAIIGMVGIVVIIFVVKGCMSSDDKIEPVVTEQSQTQAVKDEVKEHKPADPKAKIGKDAVEVMDKSFYPKAFKKFGDKYMKEVNNLAPSIAVKAAGNDSCDYVEMVTFSIDNSNKKEANWFVDCQNGKRFYYNEKMK